MSTVIHLRSETKSLEHRSALTPRTAKALQDAGYIVHVEGSPSRCFKDAEFEAVCIQLVPEGSWPDAPKDHIILGLKEIPAESFPLKHTHVSFAHCYKNQGGWQDVLSRYPRGGGTLLDLEFLQDDTGRRVAAFGFHAGFAGAALAIKAWSWQQQYTEGEALPGVTPYANEDALVGDVQASVQNGQKKAGRFPKILIIGALGRCGKGAVSLCEKTGIPDENIIKWDLPETEAKPGPYEEIVESDIFVNCIYLSEPIPPFIDQSTLDSPKRSLSVVCDVSCDTTNPHNPVPIYDINTSFTEPTVEVPAKGSPRLTVISIDHLPTLLPREASEAFSEALLPNLLKLNDRSNANVWKQAESLFKEKVATLPKD